MISNSYISLPNGLWLLLSAMVIPRPDRKVTNASLINSFSAAASGAVFKASVMVLMLTAWLSRLALDVATNTPAVSSV